MRQLLSFVLAAGPLLVQSGKRTIITTTPASSAIPQSLHKLPRIFLNQPLATGKEITLDAESSHYINTVMRLKQGSGFRVFNNHDGEFLGLLGGPSPPLTSTSTSISTSPLSPRRDKKMRSSQTTPIVHLSQKIRPPLDANQHPVHLYFAPIKRPRLKLLVEKATELGVDALIPIITQNTNERWCIGDAGGDQLHGGDVGGLDRIIIQSAEQCERLSVPRLEKAELPLKTLLHKFASEWPGCSLLVCRERCPQALPLGAFISATQGTITTSSKSTSPPTPTSVLVGPEGGFTAEEIETMSSLPFIRFVSLGPLVLRAETAALAALAVIAARES